MRLVVLTAPGQDVLPWDRSKCTHHPEAVCSGRIGCRVDQVAVQDWESRQLVGDRSNWHRLLNRTKGVVNRAGLGGSPMIAYVDEDQARGVTHRNVIVDNTPGGRLFSQQLAAHAQAYGFGFADSKPVVMDGKRASNYLAGYLTKAGKKGEATAVALAVRTGRCPDASIRRRRTIYVSSSMTTRSRCTMTSLANGRRLWAHRNGLLATKPEGHAIVNWRAVDCSTGEILHNVWAWDLPPPIRSRWAAVPGPIPLGTVERVTPPALGNSRDK